MQNSNFWKISAANFREELLKWDKILIDVRTSQEAHMYWVVSKEQILIDMYSPDVQDKLLALEKREKYLIYCHSGNRSTSVRDFMQQNNFEYVKDLEWWIDAWNLLK